MSQTNEVSDVAPVFMRALNLCVELNSLFCGPEHVLLAVLREPGDANIVFRATDRAAFDASIVQFIQRLNAAAPADSTRPAGTAAANPAFHRVLGAAEAVAWFTGVETPSELHAIAGLVHDSIVGPKLESWGVSPDAVRATLWPVR